jgi:predicted  nucleic acid-binding Zn-ribbon protein
MTKSKHDALRKDIEDYKQLLVKYQKLRIEQDILIAELNNQTKLLQSKNDVLNEFHITNDELIKEIDALNLKIEKQKMELGDIHKNYNNLSRNFYDEKGKNLKMKRQQSNLYIWKSAAVFFFFAMLIVDSQN